MSNPTNRITDLSASVRSGETTALSLLKDHLAVIESQDAEIRAFTHVDTDGATARANEIDAAVAAGNDPGPLAGIPVAIKDNLCTKGIPTTCSSRMLEGWIPPYDATAVTKLTAAGAVVVGKTNMDEFAMGSSTETSAFGRTLNPVDHSRVPGGSSGGSAAAVAAGFVPIALGSDTGGSIRQPAAFCGLVGVKPTYGTVSRLGLIAFGSSLDQIGPLTRSVDDAALILEVIAGHDPGDSTSLPSEFPSVREHLDDGIDGMRIGIVSDLMGEGVAPDVDAAVRRAGELLEAHGATVGSVAIPSIRYSVAAYYLIATAEASSNLSRFDGVRYGLRIDAPTAGEMMIRSRTEGFGDEVKRRIMLGTYALSAGYYDEFYGTALKVRSVIRDDFDRAYGDFDVLISPTTPTTAFKLGEKIDDPMEMYLNDVCTSAANLVGHPAMSLPVGVDTDGLPIGVQVMAPALGEIDMFRVAKALEGAVADAPTVTGGAEGGSL